MGAGPRMNPTLLDRARSVLVIVDVQDKLLPAIADRDRLFSRLELLIETAKLLAIPVVSTEHYPKGLGPTADRIRLALPADATPLLKTTFSCLGAPEFRDRLVATGRNQVVIAGIEAHICIMQTSLELAADPSRSVFVVVDAVSSRRPEDTRVALDRLRDAGVTLLPAESAVFEWLRDSRDPAFKALQPALKALA